MRIGLLLVGDELLTGKIQDLNGFLVAQVCFEKGICLAEIRVVADEIAELAFAVREMSERFDIVITSGGIGPTHDDKTYAAIAQAFRLKIGFGPPFAKLPQMKTLLSTHWQPK